MKKIIVLVLRGGGDFHYADVCLIKSHILLKWQSEEPPRIILLWDKCKREILLDNMRVLPLSNDYPGWWSRMMLYSPEMEQYRPFLYVDLDTVIAKSIENIFEVVKNTDYFITLEDFYQKGKLATGLAWIPQKSKKITKIWEAWQKTGPQPHRMDYFLRRVVTPDAFWQDLTDTIYDFKPNKPNNKYLTEVPENANIICLHGKPRMFDAANILPWVDQYIKEVL